MTTHLPKAQPAPFYSVAYRLAIESRMSTLNHHHHHRHNRYHQTNTPSELQLKLNVILSRVVGEDALCPSSSSSSPSCSSPACSSPATSPPCPPSTPTSTSSRSPASSKTNSPNTSDDEEDEEEDDDACSDYGDKDDLKEDDEDEDECPKAIINADLPQASSTPSAYATLASLNPYAIETEDLGHRLSFLSSSPSSSSPERRHTDCHARDAARLAWQFESARAEVRAEKRVAMRTLRKQVRRME